MGKFDSILKTTVSKRKFPVDLSKIYRKGRFATSVDYEYFKNSYLYTLLELNNKKKFDKKLISLWARLEMHSYIDFDLCDTVNLYLTNFDNPLPVKDVEGSNFMGNETRLLNLLDIKYIKSFTLENTVFENNYLATFEIMDDKKNFRPYVLLFTLNENDEFLQYG